MQEIEGINREFVLPPADRRLQAIKVGRPVRTEEAQFRIQYHSTLQNGRQRLRQERQPFRPIVTAPTVEADLAPALDRLQAVAISFGSCSHASPAGTCFAEIGLQGWIKRWVAVNVPRRRAVPLPAGLGDTSATYCVTVELSDGK
jgi:hypothetical protein